MQQTLIYIPSEIAGVKLFGMGWLLAVWVIFSAILLVRLIRRHGFSSETTSYLPILALVAAAIVWFMPMVETDRGLPIRGYGVMLFAAVVCSVALATYRARRMGVDPDIIYSLGFWIVVAGMVGARAFFVIQYWDEFQGKTIGETLTHIANVSQGGLVVYGGVIAGGVATFLFLRRYQLPALAICDLLAPSVALGMGLGRIGCFLNGCCYGGPADVAWAVKFPEGSPPYVRQLETGALSIEGVVMAAEGDAIIAEVEADSPAATAGVKAGQTITRVGGRAVSTAAQARAQLSDAFMDALARDKKLTLSIADQPRPISWRVVRQGRRSLPVHPTQLYSATTGILLCLFLTAIYPFRRRDGEALAWLMVLQPLGRFLLESIRIDEPGQFGTALSISQWISLGLFAGGVGLWIYVNRRPAGSVLPMAPLNDNQQLAA